MCVSRHRYGSVTGESWMSRVISVLPKKTSSMVVYYINKSSVRHVTDMNDSYVSHVTHMDESQGESCMGPVTPVSPKKTLSPVVGPNISIDIRKSQFYSHVPSEIE